VTGSTRQERAAAGAARIDRALLAARRCPCDPTRGMSCRYCDGTDAEDRETRADARARARQDERDEAEMLRDARAEVAR
jgi:hypothetical protein